MSVNYKFESTKDLLAFIRTLARRRQGEAASEKPKSPHGRFVAGMAEAYLDVVRIIEDSNLGDQQ